MFKTNLPDLNIITSGLKDRIKGKIDNYKQFFGTIINTLESKYSISELVEPTLVFLITRLAIFLVAYFGLSVFSQPFTDLLQNQGKELSDNFFLWPWLRWDSGTYIAIAHNGYTSAGKALFFPFYPILIAFFNIFIRNMHLSAILVSNCCYFVALAYIYKLVKMKFNDVLAGRTIFYLSIFPASFFFCSALPESTFLLTLVAALYYAEKENWRVSSVFGILCTMTRPIGILVMIPLLAIYLSKRAYDFNKLKDQDALPIFFIPIGLLFFMAILRLSEINPLAFIYGQQASARAIMPFWFDLGRALDLLFSFSYSSFISGQYPILLLIELIIILVFIGLVVYSFWKLTLPYSVYFMVYMLFIMSLPSQKFLLYNNLRLILVAFPAFVSLAFLGQNKFVNIMIIVISISLLAVLTIFNAIGGWVS